ncbi:uncharacterized protein LOC131614066 [Vicia villosa]|uniref:uncharacterized protein LOC131614066 n=1 Tax=Vicia villosa TaxID=3911 RepID=UPI00273C0202|nr:uncharacterized protein LOC131614066 [Vicia villosa]
MTHEGKTQVKETKALALIQKYKTFKKEEDEIVETMFSRFQILVAGLKVLDKGYSIADHVKKIIGSLPKKWRLMVTGLKLSKNLNAISLEELISSLRSHKIELEEDEPHKKESSGVESESEDERANIALMASISSDASSSESESDSEEEEMSLKARLKHQSWYLDSGCSRHMTGIKHMFQSLELKAGGYLGFRGNQKGKIIGSGTVGNETLPSISNVLLVDGLMHNLLSINQLSDNDYDIIFNQKSCKAVSQKDGTILFNGKRKNNIYKIKLSEHIQIKSSKLNRYGKTRICIKNI